MQSVTAIARSGMTAAWQQLGSAAHNIANMATPGFRRQLAQPQTQAEGGVSVTLSQASEPGDALAEDVVQQMQAATMFKANLRTLKTADDMMGTLLDVRA